MTAQWRKSPAGFWAWTGYLHNVLKIKPPLPFTPADAARVVEVVEEGLSVISNAPPHVSPS